MPTPAPPAGRRSRPRRRATRTSAAPTPGRARATAGAALRAGRRGRLRHRGPRLGGRRLRCWTPGDHRRGWAVRLAGQEIAAACRCITRAAKKTRCSAEAMVDGRVLSAIGEQARRQPGDGKVAAAVAGARRPVDPPRGADRGPRPGQHFGSMEAIRAARSRNSRPSRASGGDRRFGAGLVRRPDADWHRAIVDAWAAAGVRMADDGTTRSPRPSLAGPSSSPGRWKGSPATGPRKRSSPAVARRPAPCRRTPISWSSARAPARRRPRPANWAW
jgi:hypothetical protein